VRRADREAAALPTDADVMLDPKYFDQKSD
jgi:hypothetical protein